MVIALPEFWKKLIFIPAVVHGALGAANSFRPRIGSQGYLRSGALFLLAWFGGSFDHGMISIFEVAMLGLLAAIVFAQVGAYSQLVPKASLRTKSTHLSGSRNSEEATRSLIGPSAASGTSDDEKTDGDGADDESPTENK